MKLADHIKMNYYDKRLVHASSVADLDSHWVGDPNSVTYLSLDWGQCGATKVSLK